MNEPLMIRFINKITGSEMLVSSDRVEEYKAAGHVLAADLGTKPRLSKAVKSEIKSEVEKAVPETPKRSKKKK